MVARILDSFEDDRRRAIKQINPASGSRERNETALLRNYLARSLAGLGKNYKSAMILFAVAANQRNLLYPVRAYFEARIADTLAASINPAAALALTLLADGFWLFDALDISPFTGKTRARVQAYIDDLIMRELPVPATPGPVARKRCRRITDVG